MTPAALKGTGFRRGDGSVGGPLFRKLKPGPGHSAEEVFADQRARLQGAMIELAAEHGYLSLTVRDLSRAAGVSTRTFYRHFANAEECLASTYGSLMGCALRQATAAREEGENQEQSVRAALRSLLQRLAEQPRAAQLALVDAFAAGPDLLEQMQLAIGEFEQLLLNTFAEGPEQIAIPPRTVQGMVAGVTRVIRTRLLDGQSAELREIADELADWMLSLRGAEAVSRGDAATPAVGSQSSNRGGRNDLVATLLGSVEGERKRILAAVAKLSAASGYRALTVTKIRAEAGVSRRSFDAQFAGVEDCFLEAIEALTVTAAGRAERRALGAGGWEQGVRRATLALCAEIARHSTLAQLGFIDILAPGRSGLQRRERLIALGAERLRRTAPAEQRPSEMAAEASMAAAWRIVQAEIAAGRGRELPRVAPTAAHALVAPVADASKSRSGQRR